MRECPKCGKEKTIHARGLCYNCYLLHRHDFPVTKVQKPYTAKERQFIRDNWHKMTTNEVASALGRKPADVRDAAVSFGVHLEEPRPKTTARARGLIKNLHTRGFSNCMIAKQLGLAKSTVNRWLKSFGLIPNGYSGYSRESHRKKIRMKIKEDCVESAVGFLRKNIDEKAKAIAMGWPDAETLLEACVLDSLYQHGDSTLAQVQDESGCKSSWALRNLMSRGLVVVMRREVKYCVYGLRNGLGKEWVIGRRGRRDKSRKQERMEV